MATAYKRAPTIPISHTEARTYTFTIHDLPQEDKPRERLIAKGPDVLGLSELLAVIFSVGTRKEDVLSMSSRIVKEYGERSIMSESNPTKLAKLLDIPLSHASQVVASVELGKRLFARNPFGVSVIRTTADVYEYTKGMRDLPKEHLRGIYLNSHYKVIHDEVISIGTIDANIIHPREVFKPALEYAAAAVILVHNHPSGSLSPSDADITVTKQLIDAGKLLGIELIDHVVVASSGFESIFDHLQ